MIKFVVSAASLEGFSRRDLVRPQHGFPATPSIVKKLLNTLTKQCFYTHKHSTREVIDEHPRSFGLAKERLAPPPSPCRALAKTCFLLFLRGIATVIKTHSNTLKLIKNIRMLGEHSSHSVTTGLFTPCRNTCMAIQQLVMLIYVRRSSV